MKKFLLLFIIILTGITIYAQDSIKILTSDTNKPTSVVVIVTSYDIGNSIIWLILLLISITSIFIWFKASKSKEIWVNGNDAPTLLGTLRCIQITLAVISFIISMFYIDVMITGFINPEYGAIKDILDFVK